MLELKLNHVDKRVPGCIMCIGECLFMVYFDVFAGECLHLSGLVVNSLVPGRYVFLWNCPQVYAIEHIWWWVSIGSGNVLVPSGRKSVSPCGVMRPRWVLARKILSVSWPFYSGLNELTNCGLVTPYSDISEIWVNIGSCNGLLPDGTKPLPVLMLTNHQWCLVAFT